MDNTGCYEGTVLSLEIEEPHEITHAKEEQRGHWSFNC